MIKDKFGVEGVPDGFLFFPVELGGLGVQIPLIRPLQIRDAVLENPLDLLEEFEHQERETYRVAKSGSRKRRLMKSATQSTIRIGTLWRARMSSCRLPSSSMMMASIDQKKARTGKGKRDLD